MLQNLTPELPALRVRTIELLCFGGPYLRMALLQKTLPPSCSTLKNLALKLLYSRGILPFGQKELRGGKNIENRTYYDLVVFQ